MGGWVVNVKPRPLYARERHGTHCTGGWVGPSAGLEEVRKNLAPTGIRSPDRPARSESLYRVRHLGPQCWRRERRNVFEKGVWQFAGKYRICQQYLVPPASIAVTSAVLFETTF